MFCGKCGFRLDGSTAFCPNCGWRVPSEQAIPPQAEDIPPVPVPLDKEPVRRTNKQPEPQPREESDLPDESRIWEESPIWDESQIWEQPQTWQTPQPRVTPRQRIPAQQMIPPQPEPKPWVPPAPVRQKKKRHAGVVVALVLAIIVLLGVGGCFAYIMIYQNSDTYKISQAEKSILDGDYSAGLKQIEGVSSDEAEAVREFTDLLRQRDAFAQLYRSGELQTSNDSIKICYDKLLLAFGNMKRTSALPEKLKARYEEYNSRLTAMNDSLSAISSGDFADAQNGIFEFGKRKRGETFTISELQTSIGTVEHALRQLRTKLTETEGYKEASAQSQAAAFTAVNELYQAADNQLAQDKYDMSDYQTSHGDTDLLKFNDSDPSYSASAGSLLQPVNSQADVTANAEKLFTALGYAWLAFVFDI